MKTLNTIHIAKRLFGVAATWLLICNPSFASTSTGTISVIYSSPSSDLVYIAVNPAPTARPACSTHGSLYYAFDASTSAGKAVLASALTAYATGKTVRVDGTSSCTLYPNVEDLGTIRNR